MKVLLIHNFYQYRGGEDIYVLSLKKLLEKNGHKVYLYSKDSKNIKTIWDKIKAGLGLFYNPWVKKELTEIINKFKPDIAHCHNIYPLIGPQAYIVIQKKNIPIIQHIHNYKWLCPKNSLFRDGKICELCVGKKFFYPSIFYGCYHDSRIASLVYSTSFFVHKLIGTFKLINIFIFPSKFTRELYINKLKIQKKHTIVIPSFYQVENKPQTRVKNNNYFLYLGRLTEEKGILQLLEVFKTLPKIKLLVIGDGPLRKTVEKYNKYKNITVKGPISHSIISNYIKKAIAIIVPSLWYEVLPNVIIEAYSYGKPVILPHNPNLKLFIKNFVTGISYKYNDYNDLRNKIILLSSKKWIFNHNLIKKEYNRNFSPQIHYKKIINLYHKLKNKIKTKIKQ